MVTTTRLPSSPWPLLMCARWAQVGSGPVYKSVMSIGWNPFYNNTKRCVGSSDSRSCLGRDCKKSTPFPGVTFLTMDRSAEVHILNEFAEDFYGDTVRVVVTNYLRPEMNFDSLGEC